MSLLRYVRPFRSAFAGLSFIVQHLSDTVREAVESRRRIAVLKKQLKILQRMERLQRFIDDREGPAEARDSDWSLAGMEASKCAANGGIPLTDAQREEVRQLHAQIVAAKNAYDDHLERTDERRSHLALEVAVAEMVKRVNTEKRRGDLEMDHRIGRARIDELVSQLKAFDHCAKATPHIGEAGETTNPETAPGHEKP